MTRFYIFFCSPLFIGAQICAASVTSTCNPAKVNLTRLDTVAIQCPPDVSVSCENFNPGLSVYGAPAFSPNCA